MHVEIICKKENNAERVFFCSWMELCGYMVINREYAVDLPVDMQNIEVGEMVIHGLRVGHGYNRIVLEIMDSLLIENDNSVLWRILVGLMNYIHKEEDDERILYYGYHDDRMEVIEKVARLYVVNDVYVHIFILNRTYSTSNILLSSFKAINECIDIIQRESMGQNCFLELVTISLHTRLRKAQKFLSLISWEENMSLIEKCNVLLTKMKMLHYQDALYLIKSHIYETIPGEYNNVWENLRLIKSGHYYVSYQLGYLKEKYWKQNDVALDFYRLARTEMQEYYRADYKIAGYYQEKKCYEMAEYMYVHVIAKIWDIPKEKLWSEVRKDASHMILYDAERARYFTISDIEYLILTWKHLLEILKKSYKNEEKDKVQKNKIFCRYKYYVASAQMNYDYLENGIKNSKFLDTMFCGKRKRFQAMIEIILSMLLRGREELKNM